MSPGSLGKLSMSEIKGLQRQVKDESPAQPRSRYQFPVLHLRRTLCQWRDYLVQFELAAHANKGDMQTSAVKLACTRVLQKVLSLGSDYFSATFYQTYFYYKPLKFSPLLKHIFVTFLPSREK